MLEAEQQVDKLLCTPGAAKGHSRSPATPCGAMEESRRARRGWEMAMAASGHAAARPARERKPARRARRSAKPSKRLTAEAAQQLAQSRLDALESEAPGELGDGGGAGDDEYEFEDDFDDDEAATSTRSRRGGRAESRGAKPKRARIQGPAAHVARALGQRRPPRLAELLLSDGIGEDIEPQGAAGEPDGAQAAADETSAMLPAPVVVFGLLGGTTAADAMACGVNQLTIGTSPLGALPPRKHCVVSGLPALHREPATGRRFASATEYTRLVERRE